MIAALAGFICLWQGSGGTAMHKGQKRQTHKLLFSAALASGTFWASDANGSPLVQVVMYGRDITTSGKPIVSTATSGIVHQPYDDSPPDLTKFSQSTSVNPGDTVVFAILAFLSPVGTTNSNAGGQTITSLGFAEDGTNGIATLSLDAYQLSTDTVQVDFKNAILAAHSLPAKAFGLFSYMDTNNWAGGPGANGGSLGLETTIYNARTGPNNDLLNIAASAPLLFDGGYFADQSSTPESVIGTGLFVVRSSIPGSSMVKMRYKPAAEGGNGSTFQINNGAVPAIDTISTSDASESGADPYIGFSDLTLNATPEPGTLSLIGLAAAGLLMRRKEHGRKIHT